MNQGNQIIELLKGLAMRKDVSTTGISTSTNLNYYYLEPQAKALYPVYYQTLQTIPRFTPTVNGQPVGGTAINWKGIMSIGQGAYPSISEGNRNAYLNIVERDFSAPYRFLGYDNAVTFQAEATGRGFDDNIGIAQISLLNQLLIDEDCMALFGNDGSTSNGFQLGTPITPTGSGTTSTGGTLGGQTVYVRVIALTGWGVKMAGWTVNNGVGVALPFNRTSANGAVDTINGGTSIVSASSTGIAVGGGNAASVSTTAIAGAMGYAWYIGTANTASAQYFYGITPGPSATLLSITTSNQSAGATNGSFSFATDNSANTGDFTGLTSWTARYASDPNYPSYWKDLNNVNLTSNGDGTIKEFEDTFDYLWSRYKLTPDTIWLGGTLIDSVSRKILAAGTTTPVTRMNFNTDAAGNIVGGSMSVAYRSKYTPGQTKILNIVTNANLPQGVIYFDLVKNPYPAAANAIPAVRRMACLEDHFSIKWPYVTLSHQVGTYVFPTLQHYIPQGTGIITGVGNG